MTVEGVRGKLWEIKIINIWKIWNEIIKTERIEN